MKPSTKYLKIVINILMMIAAVVFFVVALPRIIVYFMPFVVAAIIALIANPFVKFLEKKIKLVRKASTAFVIVFVISLVVLALYLLISRLISEIIGFVTKMPVMWNSVTNTFEKVAVRAQDYLDRMPVEMQDYLADVGDNFGEYMTTWIQSSGSMIAEHAGNFTKNLPLTIISIIMCIIASYLFLAEKDYVVKIIQTYLPDSMQQRWNLVYKTMKTAVGGYFKAQFKIMGIVYVILLLGLIILKVDYALLIALLIAILDFLPFFGTGTVMWPWAIIAFFQDNIRLAIGLVIVWGVSQTVRQLIQPKFVGDSIGLEPIPTLVLLYIGFRVGGAFGLIVAVPAGMILINLYRAGVFSNFVVSIKLLAKDLSRLRKYHEQELESEGITMEEEKKK